MTGDGDIAVVERGGRGDRPDPARGPDQRRDRPPSARRAAGPSASGAGAGSPDGVQRPAAGAGHGPRRRPAGPRSARQPLVAARRSSSSTTRRSRRTRWPARAAARPCCGSRARPRPSSPRPTRNQAVGAIDPWLGAALSVAEATRNVSITGRAPARRHELPELRRPDPARGVLAAERGGARPRRRLPGARSAGHRRQRLALQRVAGRGDRADARDRRRRADRGRRACSSARRSLPKATSIVLVGEATPGLARERVRAPRRRRAPRTARRRSTSPARRRCRRFVGEAIARGLVASAQDVSGGGLAVALAECAIWSGLGAPLRLPVAELAGRRAVRREPVADRADGAAAPRAGARPPGPAARPAGREIGAVGGDRARDRARRRRRDGRGGGARLARRRRARSPRRRPAPRVGPRPAAGARRSRRS